MHFFPTGLRKEVYRSSTNENVDSSFMASIRPITPGFCHVIDLLKNLPDSSLRKKNNKRESNSKPNNSSSSKTSNNSEIISDQNNPAFFSKESLLSTVTSASTFEVDEKIKGQSCRSTQDNTTNSDHFRISTHFPNFTGEKSIDPKFDIGNKIDCSGLPYNCQRSCSNLICSDDINLDTSISKRKHEYDRFSTLPRSIPSSYDMENSHSKLVHIMSNPRDSVSCIPHGKIAPPVQFIDSSNAVNDTTLTPSDLNVSSCTEIDRNSLKTDEIVIDNRIRARKKSKSSQKTPNAVVSSMRTKSSLRGDQGISENKSEGSHAKIKSEL